MGSIRFYNNWTLKIKINHRYNYTILLVWHTNATVFYFVLKLIKDQEVYLYLFGINGLICRTATKYRPIESLLCNQWPFL